MNKLRKKQGSSLPIHYYPLYFRFIWRTFLCAVKKIPRNYFKYKLQWIKGQYLLRTLLSPLNSHGFFNKYVLLSGLSYVDLIQIPQSRDRTKLGLVSRYSEFTIRDELKL